MGSLEEFKAAVAFVGKHKINLVVDTVLNGLEEAEKGFEIMKVSHSKLDRFVFGS
jgi:hypothetical protein